ncbi:MAG: 5-formyltetrahydrofolate cyclo-ligase [Burkholderiales bacterium]|nr:5-formyltetrahydrofolate cyclo-ligase [Burkholderiales bacterium]
MNAPTPLSHPARAALRRQLLAARQAWADSPQALTAQAALQEKLIDALRQLEPECLGLYWPIRGEFNPRPAALLAQKEWGCQLLLPWAQRSPVRMHYRPWDGQALDSVDEFGIPSPGAHPGQPCIPDVALVPCVGFTQEGFRLGYGGGYFDRFLAAHPEVTAIGLSWAMGRVAAEALDAQGHDLPLLGILTEEPA